MKIQTRFATFVIIIVSFASFFGGYIQSSYLSQANQLKEDALLLQADLDRMERKALNLYQDCIDKMYEENRLFHEAQSLDIEFRELNNTLNWDQRDGYIWRIKESIYQSGVYASWNPLSTIWFHFNQTTNNLVIARENDDGYDYAITHAQFIEYNTNVAVNPSIGPLVQLRDSADEYGNFFSYDYIQALPFEARPMITDDEKFISPGIAYEAKADYFFYTPVHNLQRNITALLEEADILETESQQISLGVSMTTIAVVLATAMASRIEQQMLEHNIAVILKGDSAKRVKIDMLGIVLLILALFLAITSIIIPTLLSAV